VWMLIRDGSWPEKLPDGDRIWPGPLAAASWAGRTPPRSSWPSVCSWASASFSIGFWTSDPPPASAES
jgi:hypothetical protein